MSNDFDNRFSRAKERQEAFVNALPKELKDAEDKIPNLLKSLNSSNQTKLTRIYNLADEFLKHRDPYVACKKGCANCCRMNITISTDEANRISKFSGKKAKIINHNVVHKIDRFSGIACPFLDNKNTCTIYSVRPLTCRNHASFDEDEKLCDSKLMYDFTMPMVNYGGISEAFINLTNLNKNGFFADIRDFFN